MTKCWTRLAIIGRKQLHMEIPQASAMPLRAGLVRPVARQVVVPTKRESLSF